MNITFDLIKIAARYEMWQTGTYRFVLRWPVRLLGTRVDDTEPGDRLVPLLPALARLDCNQLLWSVRGEEAPALVTGDEGVPGGGTQGVNVDPSPGPGRP